MKYSLIYSILLFMLGTVSYGQSQMTAKSKTIASLGHGEAVIELMQSPDSKVVRLLFQNRKYTELTDIRLIEFANKDSFLVFIANMKLVDADHIFHHDKYMITKEKLGFGGLYVNVYDEDRGGYFSINEKAIKKFEEAAAKLQ